MSFTPPALLVGKLAFARIVPAKDRRDPFDQGPGPLELSVNYSLVAIVMLCLLLSQVVQCKQ